MTKANREARSTDRAEGPGLYRSVGEGSSSSRSSGAQWPPDTRPHEPQAGDAPVVQQRSTRHEVVDTEEQPKELSELLEMLEPRSPALCGALTRDALGFGERMIVKAVSAPEGDFRDWDEIKARAAAIAAELARDATAWQETAVPDHEPASISRSTICRMPPCRS
jgi:hypothetical protein